MFTVDSQNVFQSRVLLIAGEVKESPKQGGALGTGNSLNPVTAVSSYRDGPPSGVKPQQGML